MIAVLGRPRRPTLEGGAGVAGLPVGVAAAAVRAGAAVELVGSVGDDAAGGAVVTALGRLGVGHAALLRVPGQATPAEQTTDVPPRFEAADLELGLSYLPQISVIVAAEPLDAAAWQVVREAAAFHAAAVVAVVPAGPEPPPAALVAETILTAPSPEAEVPFADLVGGYAAGLAAGLDAEAAFASARAAGGWEPRA